MRRPSSSSVGRLGRGALLVALSLSVLAMHPTCPELSTLGLVDPQLAVGLWRIDYVLQETTCSGDPESAELTVKANLTTELVGATHRLRWAFLDNPDNPVVGDLNVVTGEFNGMTLVRTALNSSVEANEIWRDVFLMQNGTTHFNDGWVVNRFFGIGNSNPFCEREWRTSGERIGPLAAPKFSSSRFKRDVVPLLPDGVTVLGLRPVTFRYLPSHGDPTVLHVGLIAEEVVRVFPGAVLSDGAGKPYAIDYRALTGLLTGEAVSRAGLALDTAVARLAGAR